MTKPDYNASTPSPRGKDGEDTFWRSIGSAWENDKGHIRIELDALPKNGRIVLFPGDIQKQNP